MGDLGSIPGLGRSPGERQGNPLQYSCLENPHVQRSLVGYSPRGRKELDMTESPGSPRRQRATSPSAWEARVRRKRVWHGGQRMEGPEERPRGFKGVEGNIEGAEWGRMSGSSGKREVSEKQDWADPQFPTEAPISISKVMPARKQAELSRTYSHMSPRSGLQLTEKLPSGKQNQKEKTEASKEPRGKNSQPRPRGLNPRLTKRARKKFSSPGSQKVNFNLKQRTKPRTQGVNESHSKQRARKKALQPSVYWSLSHAQLCKPMDCSPPGSSVHGISQARILEWVAISFSGGIFPTQGWTWVSHIASVHTLSFNVHIFMKCSLSISNFLEETSSLSHSTVSLYFFALFT